MAQQAGHGVWSDGGPVWKDRGVPIEIQRGEEQPGLDSFQPPQAALQGKEGAVPLPAFTAKNKGSLSAQAARGRGR